MDRDGTAEDMERIYIGLEEFLQKELEGMQSEKEEMQPEKEEMQPEKEEMQSEKEEMQLEKEEMQPGKEGMRSEKEDEELENCDMNAYREDWDSKEHVARMKTTKKQTTKKQTTKKQTAKKRTKKKKGSKAGIFLLILLLLLALTAGGAYYIIGKIYDRLEYEEITNLTETPVKEDGVINILLIGNDSRTNGEDGRSDAMILLSVSNKTKKIYMTSLLRDMYVEIPGHKGNRLNAAYSFGGAELLMETIEQNLDITVNRYVLVNFEAFAKLVDAVGGVDLELSREEIEYVNAYLWEYNVLTNRPEGTDYMDTAEGGLVHLNGAQALSYSRNRYLGTDFGRTERQRKVLEAVIHNMPKALVTNPKGVISGLVTNLKTNLTKQECIQLGLQAAGALTYDIEQSSIPLEGTYKNATIREMAVLEVDFEANKEFIRKNIYGTE